jgi:hypothetical protein
LYIEEEGNILGHISMYSTTAQQTTPPMICGRGDIQDHSWREYSRMIQEYDVESGG